jgi:prepilin-type N-terminal cleavage/methylation domain-containing protein
MKNTQNKKGFTLVELIIVITILAVLATIAFVSFQGYAADSRDSKVKSEVGQLRNSIEAKSAEGVSLLSMVASTGSNLTGISVGGTGADASTTYKAGDVNFTVLGADKNKFGGYKVGASTKNGGVYQLAGKLEKTSSALVI